MYISKKRFKEMAYLGHLFPRVNPLIFVKNWQWLIEQKLIIHCHVLPRNILIQNKIGK